MKMIHVSAVIKHQARINAKIADAVAALRVADVKLEQAIAEYDNTNAMAAFEDADRRLGLTVDESTTRQNEANYLDETVLLEARYSARFFADMLDEGERPTLRPRVFAAIAKHPNENPDNTPHVEGAVLALKLAERSFESALNLAEQLNGEAIDEAYQQPYAARAVVRAFLIFITSGAFVFDIEDALDEIVAAKRTLAMAA